MKKLKTYRIRNLSVLRDRPSGMLAFHYTGRGATDRTPLVLVIRYPEWSAKSTRDKYITGINLKNLPRTVRNRIIEAFSTFPPGHVSYKVIKPFLRNPNVCVRTYNTSFMSDVHTVDPQDFLANN